jgi:excisionase family DNA binding protein
MSESLVYTLETRGYLSLNKFVKYLKANHPEAYVSYPTACKLVEEGKLGARRVGSQWRVSQAEAKRWIAEGNGERKLSASPYPKYDGGIF